LKNKAELMMHPVRMKICQALMRNKAAGLTPLEMVKVIEDVPQATLYRHIQTLAHAGIIRVTREKKVKSVSEKYYVLNEEEATISKEEWKEASGEEKLLHFSRYQLMVSAQYEDYLKQIGDDEDKASFSMVEMKLSDAEYQELQTEIGEIVKKYYTGATQEKKDREPLRTIAITMIPDSPSH
jgi:DNA-binding transcriptional ArsR family regulator